MGRKRFKVRIVFETEVEVESESEEGAHNYAAQIIHGTDFRDYDNFKIEETEIPRVGNLTHDGCEIPVVACDGAWLGVASEIK